jgi:hypothetical protein
MNQARSETVAWRWGVGDQKSNDVKSKHEILSREKNVFLPGKTADILPPKEPLCGLLSFPGLA